MLYIFLLQNLFKNVTHEVKTVYENNKEWVFKVNKFLIGRT